VLGISRLYYTLHEKDIVSKYMGKICIRDISVKIFKDFERGHADQER
jgi:hypothetical protein